jgi:peptidoglycan/LPS O-acetylase OafA/YrhL
MIQWHPLHVGTATGPSLPSITILTVAAAATALLLGVALAAFLQRRSRSYLLIVGAFAALFSRSAVAALSTMGYLSPASHHLLEHGLDVVLVALVVAAVYLARSDDRTPEYES